jgi:hypothetical protein
VLLILITVVAMWLGMHVRSARIQRHAVQAIQKYGGWVRYDFQFPSGEFSHKDFDPHARSWIPEWILSRVSVDFCHSVVQVNLNYSEDSGQREENHNPSDDVLQYVAKLPHLRVLLLSKTQATDESMPYLSKLKNLEYLFMWDVSEVSDSGVACLGQLSNLKHIHIGNTDISNSRISDDSLRTFGRLKRIEVLSLQGNQFTDAGLKHLENATKLKSLWANMGSTHFTDRGLLHLRKLSNLETLAVQGHITDRGLSQLESLENLTWVMVTSDAASSEGVAALQAALPKPAAKCELFPYANEFR